MSSTRSSILSDDTVASNVYNWAAPQLYDYDWCPAMGRMCERVTAAKSGMLNGLQTMLPMLPERLGGGCEKVFGSKPAYDGEIVLPIGRTPGVYSTSRIRRLRECILTVVVLKKRNMCYSLQHKEQEKCR